MDSASCAQLQMDLAQALVHTGTAGEAQDLMQDSLSMLTVRALDCSGAALSCHR